MRRANRTPMFRTYDDGGEEGFMLNAAGVLKVIYFAGRDDPPESFKTPEAHAKILRFKDKADAAIEAYLARVAEGRESSDGMIDFLLGGAPS